MKSKLIKRYVLFPLLLGEKLILKAHTCYLIEALNAVLFISYNKGILLEYYKDLVFKHHDIYVRFFCTCHPF